MVLKGPLGLWPFPLLNALVAPPEVEPAPPIIPTGFAKISNIRTSDGRPPPPSYYTNELIIVSSSDNYFRIEYTVSVDLREIVYRGSEILEEREYSKTLGTFTDFNLGTRYMMADAGITEIHLLLI